MIDSCNHIKCKEMASKTIRILNTELGLCPEHYKAVIEEIRAWEEQLVKTGFALIRKAQGL